MNTHDQGRLFGYDGRTMWTEPPLPLEPASDREAVLWATLDAELAEPGSVTDAQWETACAPYRVPGEAELYD